MFSFSPSKVWTVRNICSSFKLGQIASRGLPLSTLREGEEESERDLLYGKLVLVYKGHELSVMQSYEQFLKTVCEELSLNFESESRNRPVFERLSLNKSPFIYKKHQRQYEFRSHYKYFTVKQVTGCTADVFLEYVQRNLPEGIAMEVIRHRLEPLPEHIKSSQPAASSPSSS